MAHSYDFTFRVCTGGDHQRLSDVARERTRGCATELDDFADSTPKEQPRLNGLGSRNA